MSDTEGGLTPTPLGDPEPTVGNDGTAWFPASHVRSLRKENADLRIRARDNPELAKLKADNRELRISNALTEQAIRAGIANPKLLRATLREDGLLASLDPDKAGFATAVEQLVEAALENTPELRGQPTTTAVRSGSDLMGTGPGSEPKALPNRDDLATMSRANPQAVVDALHRGELKHLMGGQ